MITHPIPPLFSSTSNTLILGSFPSVKSREQEFFYGHKQNRFWKVISNVFAQPEPQTIDEKRAFILSNNLALWDVIASCEIVGSADNTIKNVTPNDISIILNNAPITRIFVNGKTAEKYFNTYIKPIIHRSAITLPSTSPANATYSLNKLINEWQILVK